MNSRNSIAVVITLIVMSSGCSKTPEQPLQPFVTPPGAGEQALDKDIEKAQTQAEKDALEALRPQMREADKIRDSAPLFTVPTQEEIRKSMEKQK